mmetsp:Transcript_75355/g.169079  ORF Transcript_75355/g.169079 Transcript_75355/m.169079 type:complete len:213 (+) Transcript_75355:124-762(+)
MELRQRISLQTAHAVPTRGAAQVPSPQRRWRGRSISSSRLDIGAGCFGCHQRACAGDADLLGEESAALPCGLGGRLVEVALHTPRGGSGAVAVADTVVFECGAMQLPRLRLQPGGRGDDYLDRSDGADPLAIHLRRGVEGSACRFQVWDRCRGIGTHLADDVGSSRGGGTCPALGLHGHAFRVRRGSDLPRHRRGPHLLSTWRAPPHTGRAV